MGIGSGWIGQVVWALALLYMHGYYPLDFLLNAFCGNPKKTKEQSVLCGTQLAYKRSRFIIKFETKAGGKIEINWRGADAREWKTPTTFGFKIYYSG